MDAEADKRLREMARQRPGLAAFTRRMIVALESIRRDFDAGSHPLPAASAGRAPVRGAAEAARRAEAALSELAGSHDALVASLWERVLRQVPDDGATRH